MRETTQMFQADVGDPNLIDPDVVTKYLPGALKAVARYLRGPRGEAPAEHPPPNVGDFLFREYLRYLNENNFRYSLDTGNIFWAPGGANVHAPTGNCQTVASNFVYLLWAFGFEMEKMGVRIVEVGGAQGPAHNVADEKLINKTFAASAKEHIHFEDAALLGGGRGTRGFRVDRTSGALVPLTPARNPFVFHAISYVGVGLRYRYYDARTGLKYVNGANDYFEVYKRGPDYIVGADREGYVSLAQLSRVQVFYSEHRPKCRIYELSDAFDDHPVVKGAVGDYDEGGNWIFVDENDWDATDITDRPWTYTKPSAHVRAFLEAR